MSTDVVYERASVRRRRACDRLWEGGQGSDARTLRQRFREFVARLKGVGFWLRCARNRSWWGFLGRFPGEMTDVVEDRGLTRTQRSQTAVLTEVSGSGCVVRSMLRKRKFLSLSGTGNRNVTFTGRLFRQVSSTVRRFGGLGIF